MLKQKTPQKYNSLYFFSAARKSELHGLEYFQIICALATSVCQLVHHLQKERGCSNLYLTGSSTATLELLQELQVSTLQQESLFSAQLCSIGNNLIEKDDRGRLLNTIACALYCLEGVPVLRERIVRKQMPAAAASAEFTVLIGNLQAVVFEAADIVLDADIIYGLVALFNVMQGKEFSGQERALGVLGFAQGIFDVSLRQHIQLCVEAQARSFTLFERYAPSEIMTLWAAVVPATEQVAALRKVGFSADKAGVLSAELANIWFDICSQRIDAMHIVEQALTVYIEDTCRKKIAQAKAALSQQHLQLGLLKEAVNVRADSGRVFNVQVRPLNIAAQDGITCEFERSMLDILQEQQRLIQSRDEALQQARKALEERKQIERAKWLLVEHYKLSEASAHERLQRLAMDSGSSIVEVANQLLTRLAKKE